MMSLLDLSCVQKISNDEKQSENEQLHEQGNPHLVFFLFESILIKYTTTKHSLSGVKPNYGFIFKLS